MPVTGKIAEAAHGELPLTWKALAESPDYGDSFLQRRIDSIILKLFNAPLPDGVEDALDGRVIDYAGKCVALELINPGIDYWSKQPLSLGATGRNENKTYADRSASLRELRTYLIEQTRLLWPEVESLLTNSRDHRVSNVPRVRDIENAHTANPYDFEPAFGRATGTGTGTAG